MGVQFDTTKVGAWVRYGALVAALFVVWCLGARDLSLGGLAYATYQNLANVASMSAAVPLNPYNTLAMQFDAKEKELTDRARSLDAQEAAITEQIAAGARQERLMIFGLSAVVALLIFLLVLNFYFDIKREEVREKEEEHKTTPPESPTIL